MDPSSHDVSQSSSRPLHVSAGAVQAAGAGVPHAVVHIPVPVVPHVVVQLVEPPAQHVKPSSHNVSQSSSVPLHVSTGGTQAPTTQEPEQVLVPAVPQPVVQPETAPAQQA